jgi:hypothetical protein
MQRRRGIRHPPPTGDVLDVQAHALKVRQARQVVRRSIEVTSVASINQAELIAFGFSAAVRGRVTRKDDVIVIALPAGGGRIEIRIKDDAFVASIRGGPIRGWKAKDPARFALVLGSVTRNMDVAD